MKKRGEEACWSRLEQMKKRVMKEHHQNESKGVEEEIHGCREGGREDVEDGDRWRR